MTMDFDALVGWLRARLGRPMVLSVQGAPDDEGNTWGNTSVSASGPLLSRDDGDIMLIDPAPGRVEAFAVGATNVVLLEGDFVAAETADIAERVLVQAQLAGLLITFAELPRAGS